MNKRQKTVFLVFILLIGQCQAGYLRGQDQTILWNNTIDPASIGYIPNVQYLGSGYNIYFANPHSTTGLDPGFTNSGILELDYNNNLWTNINPDRSYYVPDNVSLTVEKSCIVSFQSQEVNSLSQYRDSLSSSVQFQAKYFAGKFSASSDYQEVQDGLNSANIQYIESQARCSIFQLDVYNSPSQNAQLTPQLQQALFTLAFNQTSQNDYYDFIDTWGTHVVTSVNLGSRFGYKYQMDKYQSNQLTQQGVNLSVSASYFSSSGSASGAYNQTQIQNFTQAMTSWSSYSIGATPDANQDPLSWAQQTLDTPMPINISILSFDDFLNKFSFSVNGLTSSQLNTVISNLSQYLQTYCANRLLVNGKIDACADQEVSSSQIFQYSNNTFKIQNFLSNNYIQGQNGQNITSAVLFTKNPNINIAQPDFQQFKMQIQSSNTVSFIQKQGGECITYSSSQNNSTLTLQSCNGSQNQQFQVIDIAPSLFYIKSTMNNLYFTSQGSYFQMQQLQSCLGCQVFNLAYII
ncbi:MAC/perforin domain protein (macronuclear) [Tetrahymena thermophila SB210]|uniref:MAC/perforin domain protein n=1 Tax=Tetrahymena thermophila (strain SB210) TaxID=312017 RepID=Q23QV5_TETTS|nr:MAC/perforin domain protein [Tetrahymena thermophila SB210]EAR98783.1 MAC/perforin domain protein [Tetrahymena thermophila SB210]|eukprot:XP_001019028.1 MAC/perforin domain protein [Tetrahymena thermophila SB210]